MYQQAQINFDVLHERENSQANEAVLNDNRERLNNVCKKVHEALLNGIRLNGNTHQPPFISVHYPGKIFRCELVVNFYIINIKLVSNCQFKSVLHFT